MPSPQSFLFPDSPNYSSIAQNNEKARQAQIEQGLKAINAVYEGGSVPWYLPALGNKFDKSQTYYTVGKNGLAFTPYYAPKGTTNFLDGIGPARPTTPSQLGQVSRGLDPNYPGGLGVATISPEIGNKFNKLVNPAGDLLSNFVGGLFGGDKPSLSDVMNKAIRHGMLYIGDGNKTFQGFDQSFFDKRQKAYEDFANPELNQQYANNRNNLVYSLANRGLSNSSFGNAQGSLLARDLQKGRQGIVDTGIQQVQDLKRGLESTRQQAISQLYQTGNPSQAVNSAISLSQNTTAPSPFAPLANAFGNVAQQYYLSQLAKQSPSGTNQFGANNSVGAPLPAAYQSR